MNLQEIADELKGKVEDLTPDEWKVGSKVVLDGSAVCVFVMAGNHVWSQHINPVDYLIAKHPVAVEIAGNAQKAFSRYAEEIKQETKDAGKSD